MYQSWKLPCQVAGEDVYLNNDRAVQPGFIQGISGPFYFANGPVGAWSKRLGPGDCGWLNEEASQSASSWYSQSSVGEALDWWHSQYGPIQRLTASDLIPVGVNLMPAEDAIPMRCREELPGLTIGGRRILLRTNATTPKPFTIEERRKEYAYFLRTDGSFEYSANWPTETCFATREEAIAWATSLSDQRQPWEELTVEQQDAAIQRALGPIWNLVTASPPPADTRGHVLAKAKVWIPEEVTDLVGYLREHYRPPVVIPKPDSPPPAAGDYRLAGTASQTVYGRANFSATENQSAEMNLTAEELAEIIEDAGDREDAERLLREYFLDNADWDAEETVDYEYSDEETNDSGDRDYDDDNVSRILSRFFDAHPEYDPEFEEDED